MLHISCDLLNCEILNVSVQAAARSADFTFANEAEVMHLASSICKVVGPVCPCLSIFPVLRRM